MGRQTFRKVITTPEIMEQINPKNIKLQKLFLKEKGRKCSDATLVQYESALNIFFAWNVIEGDNKFYPEIKKLEINNFFDYLLDELKVNGKRFAFFKSVLSGLSDCVIKYYDEEYPTFRNFIAAVIENIPKEDVREKTIISDEQFENLLNSLMEKKKYQDACIIAMLGYSGMRISEIVQIRKSWIQEDSLAYDGLFYKTTSKMRTKGAGKMGKQIDRLILHDAFKPYFDKWVEEREKILKKKKIDEDHDFLFLKKDGSPCTQESIRMTIERTSDILGVDGYCHMWRHFFTTQLMNKYKCSAEFVRVIVRWSDSQMANHYNDASVDDMDFEEIAMLKDAFNKEK